jgi:plastocyanin
MKEISSSKSSYLMTIILLLVILGFSNSCTKSTDTMPGMGDTTGQGGGITPGPNEVFIQNYLYNPDTIIVAVGTKITWTNKDGVPHTVTSDTKLFDSGSISKNGTFSFTFTKAGTFPYLCTFHTSMVGRVVVN